MKKSWISILFWVGGVYDGVLGLIFLFGAATLFERLSVTPPNHMGYVQFPALLLIIFAVMFFAVARAPQKNRNLIPYGIMLKISYCGVIFSYWFSAGIPVIWKPFAVADLVFLALFLIAAKQLRADSEQA